MTFQPKSPAHNLFMFILMFVSCILGSIAIFVFAIGMEDGNKIVESMMTALVEHATFIVGLFFVFNILLIGMFWNRKGKRT